MRGGRRAGRRSSLRSSGEGEVTSLQGNCHQVGSLVTRETSGGARGPHRPLDENDHQLARGTHVGSSVRRSGVGEAGAGWGMYREQDSRLEWPDRTGADTQLSTVC